MYTHSAGIRIPGYHERQHVRNPPVGFLSIHFLLHICAQTQTQTHPHLVEMEVVLPAEMVLRETHDIGMSLQYKLEQVAEVERAFVHMDYKAHSYDEHINSHLYQSYDEQLSADEDDGGDDPRDDQDGTWITDEMEQAYIRLNANGISHSVECWDSTGELIGGLYGLQINGVFFGESMFSLASNASKLCFAYFAQFLFKSGIKLIDCQMHSDHMAQFGAKEVERKEFEDLLSDAINPRLLFNYPTFLSDGF